MVQMHNRIQGKFCTAVNGSTLEEQMKGGLSPVQLTFRTRKTNKKTVIEDQKQTEI